MSGKSGFLGMLVEVKTVQKVLRLLTVISRVDGWLVETKKKKKKIVCAEIFSHRPRRLSQVINKSSRSQKYTFATVTRT